MLSPGAGAAVGGIASGGGGIIGSAISARMARQDARENRAFQAHMSNTATQRAVRDMRKAGINPILAAQGLGGASTPSGAMPGPYRIDPGTEGITSALNAYLTLQQARKTGAEADTVKAGIPRAQTEEQFWRVAEGAATAFREYIEDKKTPTQLKKHGMSIGKRIDQGYSATAKGLEGWKNFLKHVEQFGNF